jgi:hypothetical protein
MQNLFIPTMYPSIERVSDIHVFVHYYTLVIDGTYYGMAWIVRPSICVFTFCLSGP